MSVANAFNRALTIPRLTVAFLIILAIYLFRDNIVPSTPAYPTPAEQHKTTHDEVPTSKTSNDDLDLIKTHTESCRSVPGAESVFILLKTGATEIYEKLPTHFVTLFKCTPHYMIFSDLAQDFADYPIHDAIAPVSKHFREHHEDFELYRKLQQYQREGQDMGKLKGGGGWNLDKWKFMPMLFQAFEAAPKEVDWFMMIEADTSVGWTNLLQWLKTMDPNKPWYLGAQNVIGDTTFAHGGSGVVLSRQSAKQMQDVREKEGREAYDQRWEELVSTSCCGDEVIARALMEADVPMTPAWPLIQGETVATIDFTENHWCTPAITWHHVAPIEIDAMWQFQADWVDDHGWQTPYLFRDVFAHFLERHIAVNRTSWNNLSQDRKFVSEHLQTGMEEDYSSLKDFEKQSVESEDLCAQACIKQEDKQCIQWMFSPGRCYLGNVMRFGKSDERESEHWVSGWVPERVESYKKRFEKCEVRWAG